MADDEKLPEPTKVASAAIKPIGDDTVHRICSGQVVLSLAIAVKELVENAIDAGATLVEIKLRDQGLEALEVSDNGCGVKEHELEALTAKYHTSKLREFVDLQGIETFGFRGEALSSLCALAHMCIITRHADAKVGVRIELDHEGKIKNRVPCARSIGTTVSLTNLFVTLPVRRRDFVRNIKKEFNKMCQILQAYCLVSKDVRIICTNQTAKSSRLVVMQTYGAKDVQSNIAAIFGNKQLADLLPMKWPLNDGKEITEKSLRVDLQADVSSDNIQITKEDVERLNAGQFELEGYISSCSHDAGRSTKDRQYLYINARPCDHKNITKLINETYHRFNTQQYPFVYLNIVTARGDVDVNLTPDKRQILLNNEKILMLAIKKSLLHMFDSVPSTYKLQNSLVNMLKKECDPIEQEETKLTEEENVDLVPISSTQRFMDVLSQWKHTGNTVGKAPRVTLKRKCTDEVAARTQKLKKIQDYLTKEYANTSQDANENKKIHKAQTDSESEAEANESININELVLKKPEILKLTSVDLDKIYKESAEFDALTGKNVIDDLTVEHLVSGIECKPDSITQSLFNTIEETPKYNETDVISEKSDVIPNISVQLDNGSIEDEAAANYYSCGVMRTTLEEIAANIKSEESLLKTKRSKSKLDRLRFKSEINPSQNQNAEAELAREISKDEFSRMEIIGQFNLGFIIVKLDTDLFIIDQHATDEKYNFEMLQRTTVLRSQPLAVPQPLELTTINEMILLDNLEIFEKNGFKFEINETAPTMKKVKLLCKPFSERWEFGTNDIDELIFMLQDAPADTICRPSRIRDMFASRACRKSVMIGDALKKTTMKTLVTHMGEIEQPWNCPHGRPTMRHLINIAMMKEAHEGSPTHD